MSQKGALEHFKLDDSDQVQNDIVPSLTFTVLNITVALGARRIRGENAL